MEDPIYIILDIGTSTIKCGISGEAFPRIVIPNVLAVQNIDPDIEGYLNIPKPKDGYTKPQALLLNYEKNKIDSKKMQDFKKLIEGLF